MMTAADKAVHAVDAITISLRHRLKESISAGSHDHIRVTQQLLNHGFGPGGAAALGGPFTEAFSSAVLVRAFLLIMLVTALYAVHPRPEAEAAAVD